MLIDCPGCAASYHITKAALSPSGRRVACPRCETVWLATPCLPEVAGFIKAGTAFFARRRAATEADRLCPGRCGPFAAGTPAARRRVRRQVPSRHRRASTGHGSHRVARRHRPGMARRRQALCRYRGSRSASEAWQSATFTRCSRARMARFFSASKESSSINARRNGSAANSPRHPRCCRA